jgi:hypothetical protein
MGVHEISVVCRGGQKGAKNPCYVALVPVNSTHADHDAALPGWIRARDLLAGEDAVKAAGAKYLPRLEGQSDEDYAAYRGRACFFNATRRAADAFVGLVFRKAPFVRTPEVQGPKSKVQSPDGTSPNPLPSAERVTRRAAGPATPRCEAQGGGGDCGGRAHGWFVVVGFIFLSATGGEANPPAQRRYKRARQKPMACQFVTFRLHEWGKRL